MNTNLFSESDISCARIKKFLNIFLLVSNSHLKFFLVCIEVNSTLSGKSSGLSNSGRYIIALSRFIK